MNISGLLRSKKTKWVFLIIIFVIIAVCWFANYRIEKDTNKYVFDDVNKIPYNKVGLLLGTSQNLSSGSPNEYFNHRIKACLDLFTNKKIEYVVISGDNSRADYNEPQDMKNILMQNGISEDRIILDYAGFRTYDAVIRINAVFGQNKFTVISQEFHNRRAVYIAKWKNFDAIAYNAEDVNVYNGFKTKLREKLARVNVFFDLIFDKKPKFLGEKIEIK